MLYTVCHLFVVHLAPGQIVYGLLNRELEALLKLPDFGFVMYVMFSHSNLHALPYDLSQSAAASNVIATQSDSCAACVTAPLKGFTDYDHLP